MYNHFMILFLSQDKDTSLENFAKQFQSKTGIKTMFFSGKDIFANSMLSIKYENGTFRRTINDINFDEIKICYINSSFYCVENYFSFENTLDKAYAMQEWNAGLLCLFATNTKTKFINPHKKINQLSNEIECLLIFQKYELKTCDMHLTNNSQDFLDVYNIYNQNMMIKTPILGYEKSKIVDKSILKNLNKLYLSPYILQKLENGRTLNICLIGNKVLSCDINNKNEINIPKGIIEKLKKIKKELNVSIISFYAIEDEGEYKFYSINQNPTFMEMQTLYKQNFENILTNFLTKEYKH